MRAEALVGIQEIIDNGMPSEDDEPADEPTLQLRLRHIVDYAELGPPDLVYVRKRYTPLVGRATTRGYYHFVRGVDVSSPAKISAYVKDIITAGLDSASMFATGGWKIVGASYRTWNAMSKMDMGVDIAIPGSVKVRAWNSRRQPVEELPDHLWREAFVCAMARDILNYGEVPAYPCLRVVDGFSPEQEAHFLGCARECIGKWQEPGPSFNGNMPVTAATSLVAEAIKQLYFKNCRYRAVVEYFDSVEDRECLIHSSAAFAEMGDLDAALEAADTAVEEVPQSSPVYVQKARVHIQRQELGPALDAAQKAVDLCAKNSEAHITLAEIHLDMKDYEAAMLSLNSVTLTTPVLHHFLRKLLPNRKNVTRPAASVDGVTDLVAFVASKKRKERFRSQAESDEMLEDLPAASMSPEEVPIYRVLVKFLDILGWDTLLSVRGKVFVMKSDMENEEGVSSGVPNGHGANSPSSAISDLTEVEINEADEIGAAENGVDGDNEGSESDWPVEVNGKKVCKPWLDYLVTMLFEDLSAMALWTAEDTKFDESHNDDAEGDAEDVERGEGPAIRSVEEVAVASSRPPVDWLRRGHLAQRLERLQKAKDAYNVCMAISARSRMINLTAELELMALYAREGNIRGTLLRADQLWNYFDQLFGSSPEATQARAFRPVQNSLNMLVSKCGLQAINEALRSGSGFMTNHARVRSCLLDSVSFGVHGADR